MLCRCLTRHRLVRATSACLVVAVLLLIRSVRNRFDVTREVRKTAFLARFEESFNSGAAELIGEPEIKSIDRFWMPESRSFQGPEVNEYVVTAQFKRDGVVQWGRWLYTCNGTHGDGIYMYSHAEAVQHSGLPLFPSPRQKYIPWATEMIDGIPSTAGASASNVSVTSPANGQITVSAMAPAGTTCRVQVYPSDALLTPIPPQQPDASGTVTWTCRVNPRYVGGQFRLLVNCQEPVGAMVLENSTEAPNVEEVLAQ